MKKYSTFKEYFYEKNLGNFIELFNAFLPNEYKRNQNILDEITCKIKHIRIKAIEFTKSELNKVEFDCYIRITYQLFNNGDQIYTDDETDGYIIHYSGNFIKGFKIKKKKIEKVDKQPFIEKLTKNLVPVITKDKMDQYASKFLKKYCPEALKTPMKLPLGDILTKAKLNCFFAPLEYDTFGKIYFCNDIADYYDNGQLVHGMIPRGTILVSDQKAYERGKNPFRNTVIHELVHWFFHSNFFELRQLLDNKLTCAVCFKKESSEEDDEIKWMESQARSITPKILMPKKMFLKQYKIELKKEREIAKFLKTNFGKKSDYGDIEGAIISSLSEFFGVSKQSVKYRLLELGYYQYDGILNYNKDEGKYYKAFKFENGSLTDHQTYFLEK